MAADPPEETINRTDELMQKFKDKSIDTLGRGELKEVLSNLREDPSFILKDFTDKYGFTPGDYNRLTHMLPASSRPSRARTPEQKLEKTIDDDYGDFLKNWWQQSKETGMTITQKYGPEASNLGFFNEETKKVEFARFVDEACQFYIDYGGEKIDGLLEELARQKALALTFADLTKPQVSRTIAFSFYLEFMTRCMALEINGIAVPEPILEQARAMSLAVIGGGQGGR